MSVSVHYTAHDHNAKATAYLVGEANDYRWATVKVIDGLDGYTELLTLFINEGTARQMATALAEVISEFDAEVAQEIAEADEN